MKKIIVLGCSGSGKSTFAIKLHEKRIVACDTIFFLDYSEDVCMDGIAGRVGQKRPDMP